MKKTGGKNATRYIPLNPADIVEEKILLPGRRICTCEASKHDLVNNCLQCGRIVCQQEGSGPCFTCGNLVCTPKEHDIIIRQSKAGVKLQAKLMNQESELTITKDELDPKLQSAMKHRDKLLEYDRAIEKRTKVVDDENDFFETDSKWLNEKEKKILKKKKDEVYDLMHNRQKQTFSFDFAGRKIVEEKPEINFNVEELLKSDTSIFESQDFSSADIHIDIHPVYECPEDKEKRYYQAPSVLEDKRLQIRIQDKELQEMSDDGHCLSMHQPHASLLVAGIKMHEGRVWYTSYRGRLWIHAAGKVPGSQEITEMEKLYRSRTTGNCVFPKSYPTGCLLGCVDVVDCLPQEEYNIQYPVGESASPYVFICENAQELIIKFPMKGKHKIFKLDTSIHQAAKKTLRKRTS